jgi:hypothetical protein
MIDPCESQFERDVKRTDEDDLWLKLGDYIGLDDLLEFDSIEREMTLAYMFVCVKSHCIHRD